MSFGVCELMALCGIITVCRLYELHMRKSDRGRKNTASRLAKTASSLPLGKDVIDQYDIVGNETSPASVANPPSSNQEQSHVGRLEESSTEYSDQSDAGLKEVSPAATLMVAGPSGSQEERSRPVAIAGSESDQVSSVELPRTSPTVTTAMPLTSKSVKFLRKTNSSGLVLLSFFQFDVYKLVCFPQCQLGVLEHLKRARQSVILSPFYPVCFLTLHISLYCHPCGSLIYASSKHALYHNSTLSDRPSTEHHGLPMTRKFPVPVYESEPSSIVAYTLRFALPCSMSFITLYLASCVKFKGVL